MGDLRFVTAYDYHKNMKTGLILIMCLLAGLVYAGEKRQQEIDRIAADHSYRLCMQ